MDDELKAKWVAALRGGEFKQGQSMLHDPGDDSYCCLGVLCKVVGAKFGPSDTDEWRVYDYVPVLNGRMLSKKDAEELDAAFCSEVGIPNQTVLISMNDGTGTEGQDGYEAPKSFAEIADYIENNL